MPTGPPSRSDQNKETVLRLFRFEHGRIAEVWEVVDERALRQQLLGSE